MIHCWLSLFYGKDLFINFFHCSNNFPFQVKHLRESEMLSRLQGVLRNTLVRNASSSSNASASVLSTLSPPVDSKNRVKRLGRGPGSGLGKTSGRGQKGQKARGSVPNWFEGGQTPIWKLFPKRGFYRHQKLDLKELHLSKIQEFVQKGKLVLGPGEVLDMKKMKDSGLISGGMRDGVAILGDGPLSKYDLDISIEATKITKSAVEIIEKAGGKAKSVYYSRHLGLRAHHSPNWFLENKGYIPLNSKPIARRDIQFYSDESRRGYLVDSDYVKQIVVGGKRAAKVAKKSKLDAEVDEILSNDKSNTEFKAFSENKILSFKDL